MSNDLLLHTVFHSRSSRYFDLQVSTWPLLSLCARQKSQVPARATRTLGLLGTQHSSANAPQMAWSIRPKTVWLTLSTGKEPCAGLVCDICWFLGIDEADRTSWKGPVLKYVGTFSISQGVRGWAGCRDSFIGCWKKKPTRSVIPVCISVMFTVMLLHIYTT